MRRDKLRGATSMPSLSLILAQARTTDVGAQAVQVLNLLLTPTGLIVTAVGLATIAGLLASRRGTIVVGALAIFLLSMMRSESRYADNTLVQPLESLRAVSRPLALVLMIALAARMTFVSRGERRFLLVSPVLFLLAFELYYLFMLGVFVDPARSAFGVVAVASVCVTMCLGFGKWMEPQGDGSVIMGMFGLAGIGFLAANLGQLFLGYSNAILGGRLAGVSGNAQQLAATCCLFIIVASYYFSVSRIGSLTRWLSAAGIGILGLFVLWSGSRTGAACTFIILATFFRARVGRLAVVLAVGAMVLLAAASLFEESTFGVERFFYGADTRTKVWMFAIDEFARYPLFGAIPAAGEEGQNVVESTYLRSLALMGIVGGGLVLMVVMAMAWTAFRAWRAARRCPWLAPQADVVVSSTAYMIIVNAAEGLMMGVLTIFVVFLYAMFATSAFVLDAAEQADNLAAEPQEWDATESAAH